VSYTTMYL